MTQDPRTTPRAHPIARPGRGRWIASGLGLALATLAVLTVPRYLDRRANARYKAAVRARADDLVRWKGWLETGSCLRRDDGARWLPGSDAAGDPVDPACVKALTPLQADPALPAEAHAAVTSWLEADRALTGASADRLRGLLDARDRALATARRQLLPAVRAQIRKVQDGHAASRDYVWWRLEIGAQLESVLDLGIEAHQGSRDVAAAINTPLHRLIAQLPEADSQGGVRDMPALDRLARATGDAAWPALLAVEDNGAWNGIEDDNAVFGAMPDEPEGCAANIP